MSKRQAAGRVFGRAAPSDSEVQIQTEILVVQAEIGRDASFSEVVEAAGRLLIEAGFPIARITIVSFDLMAVTREVAATLVRAPAVLLTLGGLQASQDGVLEAIAMAAGRPMADDPEAAEIDAYGRMSWPHGSAPVPNPLGGPAGAVLDSATVIVALPADTAQIQSMWLGGVADVLDVRFRSRLNAASSSQADVPMDN